jgi:phospholipid/cholesterol/gamma-HCH transport system substrate-binding protein
MAGRTSRAQGRSFLVGVGLLAAVAIAAYVAVTAKDGTPLSQHIQVKAAFSDVGQLSTGDDVRQNSVRVGQVSAIDYSAAEAIVTMDLETTEEVHADAKAAMWDQSALGQKFVELDTGSQGAGLLDGRVIPRAQTESATDIDQLLDALDPQTRAATGSAVRELGTGVAGHSKDLHDFLTGAPGLLTDVGTVSGSLASARTDLPALLGSAQRISAQLTGRTDQLRQLLKNTTSAFEALNVDDGKPLADTVKSLPGTLTSVRSVHDELLRPLADTRSAMAQLLPGARSLGAATPDVRGLLVEGVNPLHKLPGVAKSADPAVTGLTTTFRDARPLVPRLNQALAGLNPFLTALAPYSVDLPGLAEGGAGFTNDRFYDSQGMVFGAVRILPVIAPGTVAGLFPQGYNPYPAPGTAVDDGSANTNSTANRNSTANPNSTAKTNGGGR